MKSDCCTLLYLPVNCNAGRNLSQTAVFHYFESLEVKEGVHERPQSRQNLITRYASKVTQFSDGCTFPPAHHRVVELLSMFNNGVPRNNISHFRVC